MMKRIAENVALQTVLYFVGGLKMVKIIDYKNGYEASINGSGKVVFFGKAKDARLNYKQEHAKVRGIEAFGNVLEIGICTFADERED